MPSILSAIGQAFEDLPKHATTFKDIGNIERRLEMPTFGGSSSGATALTTASGSFTLQPGKVYVHAKQAEEPVPSFAPLSTTGVATIDANFRRRSEILMQGMLKEYSEFSLSGLNWAEERSREDAGVAATRAQEDAALARKRLEEDAAIAARRAQQDQERAEYTGVTTGSYRTTREEEAHSLLQRWKTKFAELSAALEEAVATHEQQKALEEQRLKEEQARAQEQAALDAAREAARAKGNTELAEDARRLAEMATLRLASSPSLRSFILISAAHVPPALAYACPQAGVPLRTDDRSWWKALHLLEAEGLTPPVKATEVGGSLFAALDDDSDGAVSCAAAGYMLALLTSGTIRERVEAACDAPGAPASGLTVTQLAAVRQLQQCARVRKHCAPKVVALLHNTSAADLTTMVPVPTAEAIERAVSSLFGGASNVASDKFRSWAAVTASVATLFAPLTRAA